jgi:hypothetical protein
MSRWNRDPDLPRDRETKAIGRRDWAWFQSYHESSHSEAPADVGTGRSPWAGHPVTAHDRHDRTLGIPPRQVSMWPGVESTVDISGKASPAAVAEVLRETPQPLPPAGVPPDRLAAALADFASHAHGKQARIQAGALAHAARRHDLDPDEFGRLAREVGRMIAKTTHRSNRDLAGERALNALAGANLTLACELYFARAHLARSAVISDPDLPRLWILANGLTHAVPAEVLLTVPARSAGPAAVILPRHDDLVSWKGISAAVHHLDATLAAAAAGRTWLRRATDTPVNRLTALGLLDLTHPAEAARLAARGAAGVTIDDIRAVVHSTAVPTDLTDLSDPALKAVCDRNGWLHGTPDERTDRELLERTLPAAGSTARADLARGPDLTTVLRSAPSDDDLDLTTWRNRPVVPAAAHTRQLLNIASREVLTRFADVNITPHLTRAAALAARYPDRIARQTLATTSNDLTANASSTPPHPPAPDLGL